MASWQVQEAKVQLRQVIEKACTEGPQTITRHGTPQAMVLSVDDYAALTRGPRDFVAHLLGGPKVEVLDIERSRDEGRDISL